jgi:hypothetical protein
MEDYPMNNDELFDQMVQRLGVELKSLHGQVKQGRVSPVAIEGLVRERLWGFGAQAAAVMLEAADAYLVSDKPVHDRRTRTLVSLFGPVDITRSRCQDGSYPLDEAVGLQGQHGWTVGVQEAVSLLSCECGFETAGDLMERLLGLSISGPSVQDVSEQAGQRAEALLAQNLPPTEPAVGKTLILAMDGCQAPQRDGWHEVKVGTLYTKESRYRTSSGRRGVLAKEYLATLEGVDSFGRHLWDRAASWEVDKARRVVVMGDGAPWIWNLADEHFPGAVEIVDFYHAVEHLWATGEALFGDRERSAATQGWVRHNRRQLKRGRVDLVIAAIARGQARTSPRLPPERATVVRRNLEYFRTNQHRMRYDQYRRWRLPIGTGAVEGSCKFVVQSRFKRPGSRWSRQGLGQMLALKLVRLNDRWETLWPHLKTA